MNTPVSFELAKLLKEKGFKSESKAFYDGSGELLHYNHSNNEMQRFRYEAPTISEVVMWLYEKHGIWIELTMGKDHTGVWFDWDIFSTITPRKDDLLGEEDVKYEDDPNEKWLNYDTTYNSMIDERFATMDKESCSSPTESYLSAIEYVLNNLISL